MKVTLVILVLLVVVVGGGAMLAGPSLMSSMSGLAPEPKGTEVRVQHLEPTTLVEFVSAPGIIEPHTKVDISSEVSARIEALPFREGEEVHKGDVIVRLDDEDLKAALESSLARRDGERYRLRSEEARLTGLLSNLEFARRELERQQALYQTGDVSRKALDDASERVKDLEATIDGAQFTISVIESSLAASEAGIKQAEDGLDNTVITAPMDGVITALNSEVGEQVLGTFNNIGSQIMTIADLSRMILVAEVAESDIAAIGVGQSAKVHINAYPDDVFSGTVTQIALQRAMSSDGTGIFRVEVEIDLQGRRIRSGHAANVDIEIAEHRGIAVESQAIVERLVDDLPDEARRSPLVERSKRTTYVAYRVTDGKACCTPVHIGPSDLTHTLVLDGLDAGDVVIVGPYKVLEKVKDGDNVRPEEEDVERTGPDGQPDEADEAEADDDAGAPVDAATDDEAGEAAPGAADDAGASAGGSP